MSKSLENEGIVAFNDNQEVKSTFVIVGIERSGTSMVASVLKELGVHIGASHDSAVFEDIHIFSALESDNFARFEEIVAKNNVAYDVWGWKRPQAYQYIDKYVDSLINPKFIVLYRDALAIALRNSISVYATTINNLMETTQRYVGLSKFVAECDYPMLCISYEKALSNQKGMIEQLISFLGITPDDEQITRAINSIENGNAKYLNASHLKFEGTVDRLNEQGVSGWARQIGNDQPVEIEIIVGDDCSQTIIADQFRLDLKAAGKGEGKHAFHFKFSYPLTDLENVRIRIKKSGTILSNP